ncbi:hypothetical protein NG798_05085 [Ancylothrix sp. C2]|uniref:hypothetical protein n=1 Tax=Ancylothrix sp. D3o TaxID=2953691 RepID=UPI0021BB3B25|nr:hypothetical protein [Ancylothrix sp. D3o]MCT7949154.1 hypothetical protein [Ancylothrix sp. D3o]
MTVSLSVPENISFEEAIEVTQSLLAEMASGELAPASVKSLISDLVKTENGARGFFVTYLTDDRPVADSASVEVVEALASSEEIVSPLLVKNVAMSAGMAVAHRRNGDEMMEASSQRVTRRSVDLLSRLQFPGASQMARELQESARSGGGEWESFLQRWRYDGEQRQAIEQALQALVGK